MKKLLNVLLALSLLLLPLQAGAWTLPVPSGLTVGDQVYASNSSTLQNRSVVSASYDNNAVVAPSGYFLIKATANITSTAVTISETGAVAGQILVIVNVSASNSLVIAEVAGVNDQAGTITLGALDSVTYIYTGSSWVQLATSNN